MRKITFSPPLIALLLAIGLFILGGVLRPGFASAGLAINILRLSAFLGIVAWNEVDVGAQPRRVYVPLRIGAGAAAAGGYELALVPGVELTEVYVSLAAVDGDGRTQRSYVQRRPLGFGYYPAQEPIRIPVAGLEQAGLHRIDIAVTQRNGGSANAEVWFVHAGR